MAALLSPLDAAHRAEGARMVEFAGYEMPVQYGGVIAEALAVRRGAGMFDVSHMARLRIGGPGALAFLERVTTNDVAKLADSRGQYSLLPNEAGGVVDDIIVYRDGPEAFRMVVNAANHAKDVDWLRSHLPADATMSDETESTAMIAVQGPAAPAIVAGLAADGESLLALPVFGTLVTEVAGVPCFAARSGYTGEDGFELVLPAEAGVQVWNALRAAGVASCGLGSRDALRVEAGLPLYGHELADDINPIEAGLGWVVSKTKDFIGADPIRRMRAAGPPRRLRGVRLGGKRLPQAGSAVLVDGRTVGVVTSGVYSPVLEVGIAMAFVEADLKVDVPAAIELRGKAEPGTLVDKRFLRPPKGV